MDTPVEAARGDRIRTRIMGRCEGMNRVGTGPIKVLLADDHTMFRQGLANILISY
jgi:hypothetical protein